MRKLIEGAVALGFLVCAACTPTEPRSMIVEHAERAGSGDLRLGQLDVQSLKLSIGGSGGVEVASGQARRADYSIAGSGGIDTKGVRAETASPDEKARLWPKLVDAYNIDEMIVALDAGTTSEASIPSNSAAAFEVSSAAKAPSTSATFARMIPSICHAMGSRGVAVTAASRCVRTSGSTSTRCSGTST